MSKAATVKAPSNKFESNIVDEAEAVCRRASREGQKCVKCTNSRWLPHYVNSARFMVRVDHNASGLGVCMRDADNVFGVTTADTARSVGCDEFEAVEE